MSQQPTEKIQKVLARAGLGSRREIEQWLTDGVISVNGSIAKLGDRISGSEKIRVRGHLMQTRQLLAYRPRVLMYHKPEGEICTRDDPEKRTTVFDQIPRLARGRWVMIGRLDINTSGLLLFTDDGELANRLMHPSSEIEREYAVRVLGEVTPDQIKQLQEGIELEDGPAAFSQVRAVGGEGANQWYSVVIKEGRNREVRRLWNALGIQVSRLMRVRYGPIGLPRQLRQGKYRYLEQNELDFLVAASGTSGASGATGAFGTSGAARASGAIKASGEAKAAGPSDGETPPRPRRPGGSAPRRVSDRRRS